MTSALIVIGLVWTALTLPMVVLACVRVLRGPQPWTLVDAGLAFIGLIWIATGLSVLVLVGSADTMAELEAHAENPGPSLALAMIATSLMGTLTAASFAWLRAGPAALRLVPISLRWAMGSALVVLPLTALYWGMEELLGTMGVEIAPQMIAVAISELPVGPELVLMLVMVVIGAPIVEEIVFRGFIHPVLVRRLGMWPGICMTALIFGLIHGADPHAVGPVTLLGVLLGWLRERTESLTAPIILHMANNAGAMLLVRLVGV